MNLSHRLLSSICSVILALAPPLLWAQNPVVGGKAVVGGKSVVGGGGAGSPSFVQECQVSTAGGGQQNYTTTIAASGGTAGCTTNYTAGDMIAVGYSVNTGTDLTASSISATGATITWHKAISVLQSGGGSYNGILYACPGDITSPTSSIAITVNMGSSVTYSGIYTYEAFVNLSTGCFDSTPFASTTGTGTYSGGGSFSTASSGTLTYAKEIVIVSGDESGPPGYLSAGACFGGTATVPAHGTNTNLNSATEYYITSATTAGTCAIATSSGTGPGYKVVMAGFH